MAPSTNGCLLETAVPAGRGMAIMSNNLPNNSTQNRVNYTFIRSRQLEGTFPGSPGLGIWPMTGQRVCKGWGRILEADSPKVPRGDQWPRLEPPGLDEKAKALRTLFYQRAATLDDCRLAISRGLEVMASFEITSDWDSPPQGLIPLPRREDRITASHAVHLVECDDQRQLFKFRNCWREEWGDNGYGKLPYEYINQRLVDSHVAVFGPRPIGLSDRQGVVQLLWGWYPLVGGRILHAPNYTTLQAMRILGGHSLSSGETAWMSRNCSSVRSTGDRGMVGRFFGC